MEKNPRTGLCLASCMYIAAFFMYFLDFMLYCRKHAYKCS